MNFFVSCEIRYDLKRQLTLKMTDLPTISITQDDYEMDDDDDGSSPKPNINECHTDVEDLDDDQDRHSLITILKKNSKCNGAVTDVEDFDDSDDNDDEPEFNYGPEVSLNEFLDQGSIDESSDLKGNTKNKLIRMQSLTKNPSPTAFNLGVVHDDGGVTDLEDLAASGDEADENERVYSDDDKAIVLEDSNAVDIHDSVGNSKKPEKRGSKIVEPSNLTSSESESEDEKPKMRLKTHKHYTKRSPKIEDAKSDVENIFLSDDDKKKSRRKPALVLETPDIEVMAFEGSDIEDFAEPQFPEINISFVGEEKAKKKTKRRRTPVPSPMLALPDNNDEGHTDVENLNSSDDDDDQPKARPKSLIPIALIKSDALTDVEDFGDDSGDDCDWDDKPDIPLPSPVREFTVLIENKNGEPMKQTTPLPDNLLLGFHDLDADKGLTDVEDFSDGSMDDNDDDLPAYEIECIPDFDGGVVESSDHAMSKRNSLVSGVTPEPITDTEDIFVKRQGGECRRRRTKPKHSQHKTKSNFLDTKFYVDVNAADAHTDVEDLDVDDDDVLLKDKSIKQRRATVESCSRNVSNADGKTDVEYMSDDDIIDLFRFSPDIKFTFGDFQLDYCTMTRSLESSGSRKNSQLELKMPEIRKFSPTPENCNQASTDVEDVQCTSDNEDASGHVAVSYSRAQTATPMELSQHLDEACASEIHEIHSGAFDRVKEFFEIKDNLCLTESHTDIENFDDDLH